MHVDSYQFGNVVVDGTAYNSDCLIFGDSVHSGWWRKRGHLLSVEDLQAVIAAGPSVIIVGCGASGMMKIPEETRQTLQEEGIELIALDKHMAVARFNELAEKNENVVAALHLTC
jgi:hypothetical protein